ncbi:MAG TPA: 23S rRNA (guanosine(2251)-2'-O)-methyltransferase RlmB [Cytophagales bacterium]|nr:23S rRNA (guanosine(2251)-2'-O)-methyltransferase RlmB [Cytophagales bacterium]
MEKRSPGNLKFHSQKKFHSPRPSEKELIFGIRAIIEAIKAGKEIDKILVQRELNNPLIKELYETAKEHNLPVSKVPEEKLNQITRKNHQGAISYISAVKYYKIDDIIHAAYSKGETPFIIVLDRITDVRNFGAISRTAECAGVHGILIPDKGAAQINSDAMKTSSGALNFIPICRENNLLQAIKFLKDSGLQIVASTEKAEKSIYEADYKSPVAIILGSEEDGISNDLLKVADHLVKIPIFGKIDSLNVSVATAVVTYEVVRQRNIAAG